MSLQTESPIVSSDKVPGSTPPHGDQTLPGHPISFVQQVIDKGAAMVQPVKPLKMISEHVCTFAAYSHDMSRQIETHHFISRLNNDFLQSAVYDSADSSARLIGVEYIISDKLFENLPPEEQKLWHSHAYEVKSGLMVLPRIPELVGKSELQKLAKTYGKFWCSWQVDRGDRLPLGPPALMVSPQAVDVAAVKEDLVMKRDEKYKIDTNSLKESRMEMAEPEWIHPRADYWKQHGKGFAVDVLPCQMVLRQSFP